MTDGELLRFVGESLYGPVTWRAQMARAFDKNRTLIRDYETGRWPIPPAMWTLLALAVHNREADLMRARHEIINLQARMP